jgi:hypothetical protein
MRPVGDAKQLERRRQRAIALLKEGRLLKSHDWTGEIIAKGAMGSALIDIAQGSRAQPLSFEVR